MLHLLLLISIQHTLYSYKTKEGSTIIPFSNTLCTNCKYLSSLDKIYGGLGPNGQWF